MNYDADAQKANYEGYLKEVKPAGLRQLKKFKMDLKEAKVTEEARDAVLLDVVMDKIKFNKSAPIETVWNRSCRKLMPWTLIRD